MDNLEKGQQDTSTWIKKFFDYLESILEKYMQQLKGHEELSAFMENEENLYNADGSPTEEYREWIKKVEEYVSNGNHIEDIILSEKQVDDDRMNFLKGVKDYIAKRQEITDSYDSSSNSEEWLNKVFDSDDEKKKAFEALINKELEKVKFEIK